jgi:hypothetical protein
MLNISERLREEQTLIKPPQTVKDVADKIERDDRLVEMQFAVFEQERFGSLNALISPLRIDQD